MTGADGANGLAAHLRQLHAGLAGLERQAGLVEHWGRRLAEVLGGGGRLLVAGNGGSAAEAQHLAAELVGRFREERRPLSAIALPADPCGVTAVGNDYGFADVFARGVLAHGRPGDVLVLLSTSGRSRNLLRAAERGAGAGLLVWAMTGPAPNPLATMAGAALTVPAGSPTAVQEVHLVALHALCAALDRHLADAAPAAGRLPGLAPSEPG